MNDFIPIGIDLRGHQIQVTHESQARSPLAGRDDIRIISKDSEMPWPKVQELAEERGLSITPLYLSDEGYSLTGKGRHKAVLLHPSNEDTDVESILKAYNLWQQGHMYAVSVFNSAGRVFCQRAVPGLDRAIATGRQYVHRQIEGCAI